MTRRLGSVIGRYSSGGFYIKEWHTIAAVEPAIYKRWLDAGVFQPRPEGEPYVIVIPPPTSPPCCTWGTPLNNIIQDVLIRFERMRGRAAEWLPGTDHAGIATQNVVEKQLADEGTTRFDLARGVRRARVNFVRETGGHDLRAAQDHPCSCDWSRHALHARSRLLAGGARGVRAPVDEA